MKISEEEEDVEEDENEDEEYLVMTQTRMWMSPEEAKKTVERENGAA